MQGQIPKVSDAGLTFTKANGEQETIAWSEVKGLRKSLLGQDLRITAAHGMRIPLGSPREELQQFLPLFFQTWRRQNQDTAKKALFDYIEPKNKIFGFLLICSLIFGLGMSVPMFLGGLTHTQCTNQLRQDSLVMPAEILKMKKRLRGNYKLTLQFLPEGVSEPIRGKVETIKMYDRGDVPSGFSIVYARKNPKCWVLSQTFGDKDVNWADRRVKTASTFSMTGILFCLGLIGTVFSLLRLFETRPYRDTLRKELGVSF